MVAQIKAWQKKHPPTIGEMINERVLCQDMRQLESHGHRAWNLMALAIGRTTQQMMRLAEAGELFWAPPQVRETIR